MIEKGTEAAWALASEFATTTSIVEVIQIDVSSDVSFNAAYETQTAKARPDYLDVLVNNASTSLAF
ncbi:hypothetical protein MY10362_002113 [Beauveria mimosiformis]